MLKYLTVFVLLLWGCEPSNGNGNLPGNSDVDETDTIDNVTDTIVPENQQFGFYIGTYTGSGSTGIYHATFDADSVSISTPRLVATITNPSFQSISNDNRLLFSVNESSGGTGSVTGYLIDSVGYLTKKGTFSSLGKGPCFVDFDEKTECAVTANYGSGNVTLIPVTAEGESRSNTFTHQHRGKGPNTSRQEGPHAHCSKVSPDGKYIYSCDLGTDKIYVYTVNSDTLALFKTISTAPGAGPRHIDFHPQLKSMAVIHELNATVAVYLPDADGCFSIGNGTVSTLPQGYNGQNSCADIHYSKDGKFLYASNRIHNSIVCFGVDEVTQQLNAVSWQTSNLRTPRNFSIDPSGRYLLAANQDGNSITLYSINNQTGELTYTGISKNVSKPVCITFLNRIENR